MDFRETEKQKNKEWQKKAYKDDSGIWRWKSNNRIPFTDMLKAWNLDDETIHKCEKTRDIEDEAFLNEYKKTMENHVPSDEEMYEMRAAYGPGTTVVNVVTGKKFYL